MPIGVYATALGLVIAPPDPSWARVQVWTPAAVVERGPGISREAWMLASPAPYEISSAASLLVTGPCVVGYFIDGPGNGGCSFELIRWGGPADFDCDGDLGTDADIEAFFRCLSEGCPSADFNQDGDPGTDADIDCFFRVLSGGAC